MFGVLFIWLALAVIVAVGANTRGRNSVIWFLLAVILSPLIGGLLLLAMPRINQPIGERGPDHLNEGAFDPHGIYAGMPYRLTADGDILALTAGGPVRFQSIEQALASSDPRLNLRSNDPGLLAETKRILDGQAEIKRRNKTNERTARWSKRLVFIIIAAFIAFLAILNNLRNDLIVNDPKAPSQGTIPR